MEKWCNVYNQSGVLGLVVIPYWCWAWWFGMVLGLFFSFSDNIPAWNAYFRIQMFLNLTIQSFFHASHSLFSYSSLSDLDVRSVFLCLKSRQIGKHGGSPYGQSQIAVAVPARWLGRRIASSLRCSTFASR